jgi:Xaa-Pro dipeptidase
MDFQLDQHPHPPRSRVARLLEAGWPRFSAAERARRRSAVLEKAAEQDCDLVVAYGADRSGSAVQWLCGWPVTREAVLLVDGRSDDDLLLVQFHNHVTQASELADDCEVRWGGASTNDTVAEELVRRGAGQRRVGVVGPLPVALHKRLVEVVGSVVPLGSAYTTLRLVKSDEELDRLSVGAYLSDLGVLGLRDGLRPGLVDHELSDLVERGYVPLGGTTHIHYFAISPMTATGRAAPA